MLLGCVALCWRVEGSTSSWRLVKVKLSNTCRPLWRPFVVWLGSGWHCSLKTRLLCKTFFNKYYKMGAAQKPKSFTRKTIKPNRQQTNKYEKKTHRATQLKTLKNVNCRSPQPATVGGCDFVAKYHAWVPHRLHRSSNRAQLGPPSLGGPDSTLVGCHKTIKFNFVTVPRPTARAMAKSTQTKQHASCNTAALWQAAGSPRCT